jgi:predicted ATPase/DNA-binding CsgD family transcriptional regulator
VIEQLEAGLLDREKTLGQLAEAIADARDGRGTLVVVEGAAGTGKSSLLSAAVRIATADGLPVLSARGGELEHEHAFGVVRQLFEPLMYRIPEATRERLLSGAAAPAAATLGLAEPGAGAVGAGFVSAHAIYWLTVNVSQDAPLLLAVDDAHWSDASSLRTLDYLVRRIADLPTVLLVAMRPQEPGAPSDLLDNFRTSPGAVLLRVGPLGDAEVAELVRRRIPQAGSELCRAFSEATGGNPLLIEELVRALSTNGGVPQPEEVEQTALPSLGERLRRRIERVDPDAADLARSMAVLGDGGRLPTAAALAGIDEERAGRLAHALRRIEVLSAEDPFVFVHPLSRRSLYDEIPESERHRAHEAAADTLELEGAEPERVASHLHVLPPAGSPRVAATLLAAGKQALDQAAPDETVAWLERALAEHASEPPEAELLAHLATAQTLMRDPAAVVTLRRAYEALRDPRRRGEIATSLAYILASSGEWEAAVEMIERADRELSGTDAAVHAELTAIRATVELYDPQRNDSFERHLEFYNAIAQGDEWGSRAMASVLAAEAASRGRLLEAQRLAARAQSDDLLLSTRAGSWATPQLLMALITTDDIDGASDALGRVKAAAAAEGATFGMLIAVGYRAWLSARCGDLVAAEADLESAIRLTELAAMPLALVDIASNVIDVLLERDAAPQLAAQIECSQLPPQLAQTYTGASLLETRGRLRLARKRRREGIADLRTAAEMLRKLRVGPTSIVWRSELALSLSASKREEARALAEEELELARASGLPRSVGIALRATGLLASDPARGLELLGDSVAVLERSPARLEVARSLVALGSTMRRSGGRSEARGPLERGLELASACGARNLTRRAQSELLAAGGRRRADLLGGAALTASELRVAQLAAAGASNAEIAQSLFVSLKTVETHLAHTYAKLGLAGAGSRRRLAGLLDAQRLTGGRR